MNKECCEQCITISRIVPEDGNIDACLDEHCPCHTSTSKVTHGDCCKGHLCEHNANDYEPTHCGCPCHRPELVEKEECGFSCQVSYGFIPEADCPVHDKPSPESWESGSPEKILTITDYETGFEEGQRQLIQSLREQAFEIIAAASRAIPVEDNHISKFGHRLIDEHLFPAFKMLFSDTEAKLKGE